MRNFTPDFCCRIKFNNTIIILFVILVVVPGLSWSQSEHSVAREWNEVLLNAIRGDFARPTVHARNLFHCSSAMYDAWAVYDDQANTYILGNEIDGFHCIFNGIETPANIDSARIESISYAMFRLLKARFLFSPGMENTYDEIDSLFEVLGFDPSISSTDYSTGSPAALGNYIARCYLDFGIQDGSNELSLFSNLFYESVNPSLIMDFPGNPRIEDPNRWQPLTLELFIDQSGNLIPGSTPDFLSPEWGAVSPFSMTAEDLTMYNRDGNDYYVYFDPGAPPYIDTLAGEELSDEYLWNFSLVNIWASHLDPADSVMWDISPASIGDNSEFPLEWGDFHDFYKLIEGGDQSRGHMLNPVTEEAYPPQMVPRADYARVLAEFWADGPDSETPPGHWFTLVNYINDHPLLEKKFEGKGEVLDDLEWDVKIYFTMGGAMHDAAISAWGIKGWYDYIRPVSAIRYMADKGQSSDSNLPRYHPAGMPLIDGFIEMVFSSDPLAGENDENVGKIKIKSWRGPKFIPDSESTFAGVDWILAEEWWPYQRPSFVTPPFAGYVSGHSTYSRTAAEVLTLFTGDPFFPGGVGEFEAKQNEFLVFEDGPSVDLSLQWATYRDASDQCSLSRIWGGIHPPADDIPGRLIGMLLGPQAFEYSKSFFNVVSTSISDDIGNIRDFKMSPNPIVLEQQLEIELPANSEFLQLSIYEMNGRKVFSKSLDGYANKISLDLSQAQLRKGIYLVRLFGGTTSTVKKLIVSE